MAGGVVGWPDGGGERVISKENGWGRGAIFGKGTGSFVGRDGLEGRLRVGGKI